MLSDDALSTAIHDVNLTEIALETGDSLLRDGLPDEGEMESKTAVIMSYIFLAVVFLLFLALILADVYIKYMPEREPDYRNPVLRGIDWTYENVIYPVQDFFKKKPGPAEPWVEKQFDSQAIIDRLAAKPAADVTVTETEVPAEEVSAESLAAKSAATVTETEVPAEEDSAKPAAAVTETEVPAESEEAKSDGLMPSVEVTVTPLEMSFLQSDNAEEAADDKATDVKE